MGYTPSFTPQYENGWENLPSETSPITAEAFNAYDDAIENIEEYLASDESQANLADAYNETATYEAGDYVIYGGDLYKCLEDIDEPEEWDSTKWESCLITDEMATSGGTTVIANPEGTATDTLNKLQVENTIYSVEGGGGNANIWTGTQAELEEVFDDLADGTLVNITDDEQEVVEGGTIYSEEEQVIGLWTDNKPLYQKTLTLASGTISSGVLSVGTITGVDEIIKSECSCTQTNNGRHYGLPLIRTTASECIYASTYVDNGTAYAQILSGTGYTLSDIEFTITYTKSTDAPIDAVVGKKTMYIASSDCYSTEEKEVGCWLDGKPLYQKSFSIVPTSAVFTVDVSSLNIEKLIDRQATLTRAVNASTATQQKNAEYRTETNSNPAYGILCELRNEGSMQIEISGYLVSEITEIRLTLQYTKTTDTAGSGSYTPASGKAVHYSTDEQVIGTWIDGSTLYRKTLTGDLTPSGTSYSEIVGTLSSLGATFVTKAEGFLQNTVAGGLYKMAIPSYVNSTNASGVYITGTGDIKLYVTGTYHKYYLTLEYIK